MNRDRQAKRASGDTRTAKLSRRRFVALAGLAALSASAAPSLGTPETKQPSGASRPKKPAAAGAASAPAAAPLTSQQKEFERQRAGTLAALKTIRAYPLMPGGDLPVVFRPLRTPKRER